MTGAVESLPMVLQLCEWLEHVGAQPRLSGRRRLRLEQVIWNLKTGRAPEQARAA